MHFACVVLLTVVAVFWVMHDLRDWGRVLARLSYLGKLCLLTVVCFLGIHLVNSIPAQVQANTPPSSGK
ncbi:hypothetical protein [Anthocerotibacter panamensis]|uniref:hypothetical protein n=1 Tax=Anthocerotibacter panamensis TaxID=2857077 RepID=UPI001C403AC1|nr:hypothetical protein [Anthocerotibacter panamensis]